MMNISSLPTLYKRDSKGKVREWTVQVGWDDDDIAGTRTISGLVDGKKVTSVWNLSEAKNVGRSNATNSHRQAQSEAQSVWDINIEKEYFDDVAAVDSYTKFEPMLAADYAKLKEPLQYTEKKIYSQPKLDGIRCIARADGVWSRSGKRIISIPHIEQELAPIFEEHPDLILDGELYNHVYKDNFNEITSMVRRTTKLTDEFFETTAKLVQYHVYDMYDKQNPDIEFSERHKKIVIMIGHSKKSNKMVIEVPTVFVMDDDHCNSLYADYLESGWEGQMLRRNKVYEPNKRSGSLLKRKEFITEEFKVISVEEGQGNWSGCVKRFVLEMPDGRFVGAGVKGTQKKLKELFESDEKPTWATLRYFTPTPDGIPRFPVVIAWGVGVRDY